MSSSTTRLFLRLLDTALETALRTYMPLITTTTTTTPSAADPIAAYESGVSALLTSALENDILFDVRRADFDAVLLARLDNVLDDRMRWAFAFDETQRERVRLLRETLNTHIEHYRAMWRREMIRHIVEIRSDAGLARARAILEAADSGDDNVDNDNAAEGAEPEGAVMAEGSRKRKREDSEDEAAVDNEEDADEESEVENDVEEEEGDPHDEESDDEEDDCIMFGMYNGGQGVSRCWGVPLVRQPSRNAAQDLVPSTSADDPWV